MWAVAVLLLIASVMMLGVRVAKTQRTLLLLNGMAIAVWPLVVAILARTNDYAWIVLCFVPAIAPAVSRLMAIPFLRKRVKAPRFRVKILGESPVSSIILLALGILLVICSLAAAGALSSELKILFGLMAAALMIQSVVQICGTTEICGNGMWHEGSLDSWEEYESFFWEWTRKDGTELTLVSTSRFRGWERLLVQTEDREAVDRLLAAHLPNRSRTKLNSQTRD